MRRCLGFVAVLTVALGLAIPNGVAHGASAAPAGGTRPIKCEVKGATCGYITRLLDPSDPSVGTINIGYELHVHTDKSKAPLEPIVAMEGGPGYATTASRDWYLDLFAPIHDRHDILFVDQRGTGMSGAINCKALQSYKGDYNAEVGQCGKQLGAAADVYGSAFATDDIAAVLDALHIPTVDLYGDSYGTFLAQTFAVRHPDKLRTLTLDSAYPVENQDPWYRDSNRAMRDAFRFACARAPQCTALGGDIVDRLRTLDDALRAHPLTGYARTADGVRHLVKIDPGELSYIAGAAAYGYPVYRELDGAARAYLDDHDPAPLLRIAAEQNYYGNAGPVKEYSEGLADAVDCNDYPQLWDINAPISQRSAQLDTSIAALRVQDPNAFDPFTIDDWMSSYWTDYTSCINWPVPSHFVPPLPDPHTYPNVPTLVLSGDLDSLTSPEGAHIVAAHFPNSTFVDTHNGIHVMGLGDNQHCASSIIVRFVRTLDAGDTSCAALYPPVRMIENFPETVDAVSGNDLNTRIENVALNTVTDMFTRWADMLKSDGVGLRGGKFHTTGDPIAKFTLNGLRWVTDAATSGNATWNRVTGDVTAHTTVVTDAGSHAALDLSWNEWVTDPNATVRGTIDGHPVKATLPTP
jgi:pimeloyl-ACP methyl ester carboxylesterase